MKNFKLYDIDGNVIYNKEYIPSKFKIMEFYQAGLEASNTEPIFVDIQKTIKIINETNFENIKYSSQAVLVIEDEAILRKLYKEHLSRLNHFVEIFATAEEAFDIFSKDPSRYDILLTDNLIEGGNFNGSDIAKRVKTINNKIKVFIVTGDMQSIDDDIFDFNIDGTLNKPIDSFTFINTVGNGKRVLSTTSDKAALPSVGNDESLDKLAA